MRYFHHACPTLPGPFFHAQLPDNRYIILVPFPLFEYYPKGVKMKKWTFEPAPKPGIIPYRVDA
jgi:hypothetical protein